jgi:hypothetical protein
MIKKLILILTGLVLAFGVLGVAGYAYAQATDPDDTVDNGRPADRGVLFVHGHWFGWGAGDGVLHDYLLPAFAKVFGLNADQVQAFEVVQETLHNLKESLTADEMQAKMGDAFSEALDAAVADDAITQEQADQMLARQQQMGGRRGPGGRGGGRMPMGEMGFDRRQSVLSVYVDAAWADALDLTADEWNTLKAEGFNLVNYAAEQDLTVAEMQALMKSVYTTAIDAALDDGALTQEQADDLLERLESMDGRMPFGPGTRGHGW